MYIQGVSVYTNVSANYMFRPFLVRPSSVLCFDCLFLHVLVYVVVRYTTGMTLLKSERDVQVAGRNNIIVLESLDASPARPLIGVV